MTEHERKFYMKGYQACVKARELRWRAENRRPGRPIDSRKAALARMYALSEGQLRKISQPFLDQLDRCKDDDARRVLLGAVLRREAVSA